MQLSKTWKLGWWFLASPFHSLLLFVQKADGSWRRTVNYHKLNREINLLLQMWSLYWSKSTHSETPGIQHWSGKSLFSQAWSKNSLEVVSFHFLVRRIISLSCSTIQTFAIILFTETWLSHHFTEHNAGPLYWCPHRIEVGKKEIKGTLNAPVRYNCDTGWAINSKMI